MVTDARRLFKGFRDGKIPMRNEQWTLIMVRRSWSNWKCMQMNRVYAADLILCRRHKNSQRSSEQERDSAVGNIHMQNNSATRMNALTNQWSLCDSGVL